MQVDARRRTHAAAVLIGVLGFGLPAARSQDPPAPKVAPPLPSDYSQRVVAYIYGSVPITREDLGEFLIARQGAEKLELLVNKRIIEHACQQAGIEITPAEIEAALDQDCGVMKINRSEFVNRVLKQYGKTLYEWKEDVLKPRLMLQKFCQDRIKVNEDDVRKAFESQYGEKVECRIIIWPKGEERVALNEFDAIRKSEEGFARKAASQAIAHLAAVGGRIMPIARHSGTNPKVEEWAFKLQPGEVSELIATPDGTVCIKVDRKILADDKVKIEDVREQLERTVFDKKVSEEIPVVMKELREKASPKFILKKNTSATELEAEVRQELQQTGGIKK
jgi:hypothetical protein